MKEVVEATRGRTRVWRSRQTWNYECVWQVGCHQLRTTICRDTYDFQSSASVDRWDGDQWQNVLRRTLDEMGGIKDISIVASCIKRAAFEVPEFFEMQEDAIAIVDPLLVAVAEEF